ncbi:hypothetical protein J7M23_01190 [Candidatus Sumerlaeota bacterium]|nr:hypothetical protein [Candidatus Sumerlaeota bacterium]
MEIKPYRLYRVEIELESDQMNATLVPSFRLRVGDDTYEQWTSLVVADQTPTPLLPTRGNPRKYVLYFQPAPGTDTQRRHLHIALDLLSFTPTTHPTATLYLRSVRLSTLNLNTL